MKNKKIIANSLLEAELISKLESLTGKSIVLENRPPEAATPGEGEKIGPTPSRSAMNYERIATEFINTLDSDKDLFRNNKKGLIDYTYDLMMDLFPPDRVRFEKILKTLEVNPEFRKLVRRVFDDSEFNVFQFLKDICSGLDVEEIDEAKTSKPSSNWYDKNPDKNKIVEFVEEGKKYQATLSDLYNVLGDKKYLNFAKCKKSRYGYEIVARFKADQFDPRDSNLVYGVYIYFFQIVKYLEGKTKTETTLVAPGTVGPEQPEERGLDQGGSRPLALSPELKGEMRKYHIKVVDAIKQVRAKTNHTFGEQELTKIMLHIAHLLKQGEKPSESTIYHIVYNTVQ